MVCFLQWICGQDRQKTDDPTWDDGFTSSDSNVRDAGATRWQCGLTFHRVALLFCALFSKDPLSWRSTIQQNRDQLRSAELRKGRSKSSHCRCSYKMGPGGSAKVRDSRGTVARRELNSLDWLAPAGRPDVELDLSVLAESPALKPSCSD